jgi:hypothetical protein
MTTRARTATALSHARPACLRLSPELGRPPS